MDNDNYISPIRIKKQFDITSGTLRQWAEDGKIKCIRANPGIRGGQRRYNIADIKKILGLENCTIREDRKTICYARVSSNHQKEDLERQIKLLKEAYPKAVIIRDIGSGLNWKRPGFRSLLEQVYSGDVKEVVVTYRDRMCRFGYELVEWIFQKSNVKLVVLDKTFDVKDASKELSDDLLTITTVFVAKNNGLRAANYKRQRKEADRQKNKSGINKEAEMDGIIEVDVQ